MAGSWTYLIAIGWLLCARPVVITIAWGNSRWICSLTWLIGLSGRFYLAIVASRLLFILMVGHIRIVLVLHRIRVVLQLARIGIVVGLLSLAIGIRLGRRLRCWWLIVLLCRLLVRFRQNLLHWLLFHWRWHLLLQRILQIATIVLHVQLPELLIHLGKLLVDVVLLLLDLLFLLQLLQLLWLLLLLQGMYIAFRYIYKTVPQCLTHHIG